MTFHRWFLLPCAAALAACTASSPQPQPPAATVSTSAEPAPVDIGAPPAGTTSATAATGAAAADPPKSVITNDPPPGGTVTSNGSVVTDKSDRFDAMVELVKANRDGFRKCFDLWGKKNPGQPGKISFQFFLKPDGKLEKAQMKRDEGDVHAAEVENCMIDFAKTLAYPKSSVGKDTIYTHRFEFKAAK